MTTSSLTLEHLTAANIPHLRLDAAGQLVDSTQQSIITTTLRKLPLQVIAHLKAAVYWLHDYQPDDADNHIDQVRGYLEAFHHLCELSAWNAAYSLLQVPIRPLLTTHDPIPLHQQLEIWGYYQELSDLLRSLLGKLDNEIECFCLTRLGRLYQVQGQFTRCVVYYRQALIIAQEIEHLITQINALLGLSNVDSSAQGFQSSLEYAETALKLACDINDSRLQAKAFYHLASLLCINCIESKQQKLALNYAQAGLQLAQLTRQTTLECNILGILGTIYSRLGQHQIGLNYLQQQLKLARLTNNRYQQWVALVNVGTYFLYHANWELGRQSMNEALQIARELKSPYCESFIFRNQISLMLKRSTPASAQEPLWEALALAQRSHNTYLEWILLQAIAASFLQTNQLSQAQSYLQQAEALVAASKISGALAAIDFVNFSYLLSRAGNSRAGFRYAKRGIAVARRHQLSQEQFWGVLVLAYAYWQSRQRLMTLLILLRHAPTALAIAGRDPSVRYSLSMALEQISQPLVELAYSLHRLLHLQVRKQQPD